MAGKGTKNNQQNTQGDAQTEQAVQTKPLDFDVRIHSIKPNESIKGTASVNINGAELIKDRLQEVLGDIRLAEEIIYSANPVVNAILKVKSIKAKEKEIPMQVTTLLPQRVSVDIGDMGVLYGNLLDNAIEAAMAVEQEKRYVHVESKFQEGRLLLSIKNSKPSGTSSYQQTNKKDKIKHGRGIRSVRKVAEKYGGELLLKDQGEHFEAVLLLNGVAKLE